MQIQSVVLCGSPTSPAPRTHCGVQRPTRSGTQKLEDLISALGKLIKSSSYPGTSGNKVLDAAKKSLPGQSRQVGVTPGGPFSHIHSPPHTHPPPTGAELPGHAKVAVFWVPVVDKHRYFPFCCTYVFAHAQSSGPPAHGSFITRNYISQKTAREWAGLHRRRGGERRSSGL